jgi:hypothetical protein
MFSIKCVKSDGTTNTTTDISYNASPGIIGASIVAACYDYRDAIDVSDGNTYNYYEDGRDIIIRFVGIIGDVSQFMINDGVNTPLSGS